MATQYSQTERLLVKNVISQAGIGLSFSGHQTNANQQPSAVDFSDALSIFSHPETKHDRTVQLCIRHHLRVKVIDNKLSNDSCIVHEVFLVHNVKYRAANFLLKRIDSKSGGQLWT